MSSPDWKSLIRERLAPARLTPSAESDVVEELSQHVDDRYRDLRTTGAGESAAIQTALSELDGHERLLAELARTPRAPILDVPPVDTPSPGRWFRTMWLDSRHALRSLRLAPVFALTVIVTMALTIGPATAIVSVGNWLLWRPIAGVHDPGRLAEVHFGDWQGAGYSLSPAWVSYLNLADLNAAAKTSAGLAGVQEFAVSLAADGVVPRRVGSSHVTANFFELVGVRLDAGRAFTVDEDRFPAGAPVAVISHRLGGTLFGAAANAIGKTVHLNGRPMSIVGVVVDGFAGISPTSQVDVWYPGATYRYVNHAESPPGPARRDDGGFYTFVMRLAPGATFAQAQAELDALAPALAQRFPDENERFKTVRARVFPALGPMPGTRPGYQRDIGRLLGVAALLVLLGCANVANLLLFRAARERHVLAIRQALGASRLRLMQLQLLRGLLLALAGAAAGIGLAAMLKEVIQTLILPESTVVTAAIDVPVDHRVLAITLLASVVCAGLSGFVPSWLSTRQGLAGHTLHMRAPSSAHAPRLRTGFAALQLALSLTLLIGALLTGATLRNLRGVDLGFAANDVSIVYVEPGSHGYTPARARTYHDQLLAALESHPSLTAVSLAGRHPFTSSSSMQISRRDDAPLRVRYNAVDAGYFDVLGIPIIHGRAFTQEDVRATPAATPPGIVSAALARQLFGTTDVLGRTLTSPRQGGSAAFAMVVVGVSGDIQWRSVDGELTPLLYLPFGQDTRELMFATVMVKSGEPLRRVTEIVQASAARIDPSIAVPSATSLESRIDGVLSTQRLLAFMCALLGAIGCVLAGLGVFGLSAQSVIERTREFGIRLAIGATRGHVARLVLRQAAWVVAIGGLCGVSGAAFASRWIESRLFGVDAHDPRVYALAVSGLIVIVILASVWPARTATRVDPVSSLRDF